MAGGGLTICIPSVGVVSNNYLIDTYAMDSEDAVFGPYDVMDYERELTDFLTSYRPEEELEPFPIWESLQSTRDMVDHFFKGRKFEFTRPVRDVSLFGKMAQNIKQIDTVGPDGSSLGKPTSEVFAERLLKEENPWEAVYELQIASYLTEGGFEVKLVEEGSIGGPDIYVHINGDRIDVECKRRRPGSIKTREDEANKEELQEKIFEKLDLGTGERGIPELSFYLEFTGDGPLVEDAVDVLANLAVEAIENKQRETEVEVADIQYRILLKDYFFGEKNLDITTEDLESMRENLNERHIDMFLSKFDARDLSPGMATRTPFYIDKKGSVFAKGIQVINHRFPNIDEEYYSRIIKGAISKGRSDLKDRSPSTLFVYLPAYEFEDMHRATIEGYEGNVLPQIERLEQMIEGQLKQSSSLNAIVLSTTYFEFKEGGAQFIDAYSTFGNLSPDVELPTEFKEYLHLLD